MPGPEHVEGVHLERTDENVEEIDRLADLLGGRAGLGAVTGDLNRRGRRSPPWGRAVHWAFTWDRADRADHRWWPQGVSTSADADDPALTGGRRMVAVTWYAKRLAGDPEGVARGARVTFVDLDTLRYRHVLLVTPQLRGGQVQLAPLRVHAGGVVWSGPYLHVAATSRGFVTCRTDDLLRVPDDRGGGDLDLLGVRGERVSSYAYRYLLPVRFRYQAYAADGHERLRYSFLSLDRHSAPPQLVAGEYGRGQQSRRLAHYSVDPLSRLLVDGGDGRSRPALIDESGVRQMQGVCVAQGRYYATVSHGPFWPGSVYVGRPGEFRRHRFATPMGPEDIDYWSETDQLWSCSEHPHRRWVFAMRRSWFDAQTGDQTGLG